MVAKTEKDKADDAALREQEKFDKEKQEQAEAASKAEDENRGKLAATTAVAAAAAEVNQERQRIEIANRQANLSVGLDAETGEEVDSGEFAGQMESSDNYSVVTTDYQGRQVVKVLPVGWVGPAPLEVPAARVKELAKLLSGLKNLPKE